MQTQNKLFKRFLAPARPPFKLYFIASARVYTVDPVFGLVFAKTGSINSGTGLYLYTKRRKTTREEVAIVAVLSGGRGGLEPGLPSMIL